MKKSTCYTSIILAALVAVSGLAQGKSQLKPYGYTLCKQANFQCVKVKKGDTWKRLFPNKTDREIVRRVNRTNAPLYRFAYIAVPDNLSHSNHLDHSPYPHKLEATGKRFLLVQLDKVAFGAYDKDGRLVHWGPISGGREWCLEGGNCKTVTGDFNIYRKQGANCKSGKYPIKTNGGAPMPYCMHFYRGFAIHGSTLPGFHASHGCVRLLSDDAKWLNEHFAKMGTRVIVKD